VAAGVLGCLKPGVNDATTSWEGMPHSTIAAQCCTATGQCRREHANECIAGDSQQLNGRIEALTYAQAVQKCAGFGLQMCQQSCTGKGCYYNQHPVFTSLPC
jgi:hypothetical protein